MGLRPTKEENGKGLILICGSVCSQRFEDKKLAAVGFGGVQLVKPTRYDSSGRVMP